MSKHNDQMAYMAKYIACGMVVGSAVGTAAAVMMNQKKKNKCKACKKPDTFREKAASAMDTVGSIMQNIADITR